MMNVYATLRAGLMAGLASGEISADEASLADLWLDLIDTNTKTETLEP